MKKFTRNMAVIMGVIVLICSFSLAGCKKEEAKTEVIVESEGQMSGVLVSFEGKTLVTEEAGKEYNFDVSNAEIKT